jgi:hypothetical protein
VTALRESPFLDESGAILLTFPGRGDLMVLARITAATIAATAGFGVEQIEDLRLAVEELCLMERRRNPGTLHLAFLPTSEGLEVRCNVVPGDDSAGDDPSDDAAHDFSQQILDALVDAWGEGGQDGTSYTWLRMDSVQGPLDDR